MDIEAINSLSYEDFGNVVERCPIITAAVWSGRPFASGAALEAAINAFIEALPESGSLPLRVLGKMVGLVTRTDKLRRRGDTIVGMRASDLFNKVTQVILGYKA